MNRDLTIEPLLVTPFPRECESLLAFSLRTSEMNGYASPGHIFRYAGMNENETRIARIPLDKLAKLYGRSTSDFETMAYAGTTTARYGKNLRLLRHPVPAYHLQLRTPKVCPECVLEDGYISAFWELGYAVACPRHRRLALKACPTCERPLSWNRKGLLICACGHDFSAARGAPLENAAQIALLDTISAILFRQELPESAATAGFPIQDFGKLSLRTLLGLVERLGNLANGCHTEQMKTLNKLHALEIAANAFSNWPNGLVHYMESLRKHNQIYNRTFRQEFDAFFSSIVKSQLPKQEIEFIRRAAINFGASQTQGARVGKRMLDSIEAPKPLYGGISDAAALMGVMPSTVSKMIKAGALVPVRNNSRFVALDLASLPKRDEHGGTMSAREAAKALGLPVSVLAGLRARRFYVTNYIGDKTASYHPKDVEAFRRVLLSESRVVKPNAITPDMVCVAEIMRMKTGNPKQKVDVMAAVLTQKLHIVGRTGETADTLVIERNPALRLITAEKAAFGQTAQDAASALACDGTTIPWLLENGYLQSSEIQAHFRISEKSVAEFSTRFVFLRTIANMHKTSSRALVNQCQQIGIRVLMACRKNSTSVQPFILRTDVAALENALKRH